MTNGGDTGTRGRTSKQHGDMNTIDINNNPQQTWGRTDYIKGDITGNTWDTIKTQTETNQLMKGNRTDQIWAHKGKETQAEEDKV